MDVLFPGLEESIIEDGLSKTSIPGRFQIIETNPNTVLDGSHTEKSVVSAVNTFKQIYGDGVIIFGAISGKNIEPMAKAVSNVFNKVIISTPGSFKKFNIDEIEDIFKPLDIEVYKISAPSKALKEAKKSKKPILVTGSFYMAGEIGKLLLKKTKSVISFKKPLIMRYYGYIAFIPFLFALQVIIKDKIVIDYALFTIGITLFLTLLIVNQLEPYIKITPLRIILFTDNRNKPIIQQRKNIIRIEKINKRVTKLVFRDGNYIVTLGKKEMTILIKLLEENL